MNWLSHDSLKKGKSSVKTKMVHAAMKIICAQKWKNLFVADIKEKIVC